MYTNILLIIILLYHIDSLRNSYNGQTEVFKKKHPRAYVKSSQSVHYVRMLRKYTTVIILENFIRICLLRAILNTV